MPRDPEGGHSPPGYQGPGVQSLSSEQSHWAGQTQKVISVSKRKCKLGKSVDWVLNIKELLTLLDYIMVPEDDVLGTHTKLLKGNSHDNYNIL